MPRPTRSVIAVILSLGLFATPTAPAVAGGVSRANYEACHAVDEETFRRAVEAISLKALESATRSVDYAAAIGDEWRRIGMDAILDKQVDIAVEQVRNETSWSGLAKSLVDKATAQSLATAVAERVYRSDAVKTAIESLATGVGKEVGRALEKAAEDAAGPQLECLKAFLGPRYGTTVAGVVTADVEKDFGLAADGTRAEISSGAVLRQSSEGITGAAILLLRRQLANMATRLGQRLAGSVLSRLVSVAAGGVGLVLIAKDLWELRNGVLPIVADEMKSQATKDNVKAELAKSISGEVAGHLQEIAAKTADRIIGIWQEFRRAHLRVIDLAERDEPFRRFLDSVEPTRLSRLDEVAAIVFGSEGDAGIARRLADGTLNDAVRTMPDAAMGIAREQRSLDVALAWWGLAGDRLQSVVDLGIAKRTRPESFTPAQLTQLLAVDDALAVGRLAAVPGDARARLLELGPADLKRLGRSLTEAELATLSGYLTGLDAAPRERVLTAIAENPARMRVLASAQVRDAVIASRDQAAAVNMMLADEGTSIPAVQRDVTAAWEGRIAPSLVWHKHPAVVIAFGVAALFLLMLLWRLLSPARRQTA